jgi:hypothetical protein
MPLLESRGSGAAFGYGFQGVKGLTIPYASTGAASADGVVMYFTAQNTGDTSSRIGSSSATLYQTSSSSNSALGGNGWNRGVNPDGGMRLNSVPTPSSYTFSFWFYITDTQINSPGDGVGIHWMQESQASIGISFGYDGGNDPNSSSENRSLKFSGNSWVAGGTQIATVSRDTWYHVAYSKTGSDGSADVKVYLNGQKVLERNQQVYYLDGTMWFSNYSLHGGNTNKHFHRGIIDEVIMWNRVLTDAEMSNYYTKAFTSGLITSIGRV